MAQVSCVFAQEKSAAFFDHQLSQAETELVISHIEECETCAQMFAQLEQLEIEVPRLQLATQDRIEDPQYWDAMDSNIYQELDAQERRASPKWDGKHFVLVALLLLSVGWGWFQSTQRAGLQMVVESQQKQLDQMHQRLVNSPTDPIPAPAKSKARPVRFDL